jgi:hypothetical protein
MLHVPTMEAIRATRWSVLQERLTQEFGDEFLREFGIMDQDGLLGVHAHNAPSEERLIFRDLVERYLVISRNTTHKLFSLDNVPTLAEAERLIAITEYSATEGWETTAVIELDDDWSYKWRVHISVELFTGDRRIRRGTYRD